MGLQFEDILILQLFIGIALFSKLDLLNSKKLSKVSQNSRGIKILKVSQI